MALSAEARAQLEWIRDDYVTLVRSAAPADLDAPSEGTRWTNRELAFHLWFGQRIARALIPVMGAFSRLPPSACSAGLPAPSCAAHAGPEMSDASAARASGLER